MHVLREYMHRNERRGLAWRLGLRRDRDSAVRFMAAVRCISRGRGGGTWHRKCVTGTLLRLATCAWLMPGLRVASCGNGSKVGAGGENLG